MTTSVHIIDSSKPSLVMSSEVFKDKIPGALVSFSLTAKDGLTAIASKTGRDAPDVVVVDFDLPDADGVSLIRELRKTYKGPIILTAFPGTVVQQAVQDELFHYNDSCAWVSKPVKSEDLEQRIDQFLVNRYRLGRRFDVEYPMLLVGKGAGRGKRAPKFDGQMVNISMGGACVELATPAKLKAGEEFLVTLAVPSGVIEGAGPLDNLKPIIAAARAGAKKVEENIKKSQVSDKGKKPAPKSPVRAGGKAVKSEEVAQGPKMPFAPGTKLEEYKIKVTVAWLANGGTQAGLSFAKISDQQRRQIEVFLKGLPG